MATEYNPATGQPVTTDNIQKRRTSSEMAQAQVDKAKGAKKESILSKLSDTDVLLRLAGAAGYAISGDAETALGLTAAGALRANQEANFDNRNNADKLLDAENKQMTMTQADEQHMLGQAMAKPDMFADQDAEVLARATGTYGTGIDLKTMFTQERNKKQDAKKSDELWTMLQDPNFVNPEARESTVREVLRLRGIEEPHPGFAKDIASRDITISDFHQITSQMDPDSVQRAMEFLGGGPITPERITEAIGMMNGRMTPEQLAAYKQNGEDAALRSALAEAYALMDAEPLVYRTLRQAIDASSREARVAITMYGKDFIPQGEMLESYEETMFDNGLYNEARQASIKNSQAINDMLRLQPGAKLLDDDEIQNAADRAGAWAIQGRMNFIRDMSGARVFGAVNNLEQLFAEQYPDNPVAVKTMSRLAMQKYSTEAVNAGLTSNADIMDYVFDKALSELGVNMDRLLQDRSVAAEEAKQKEATVAAAAADTTTEVSPAPKEEPINPDAVAPGMEGKVRDQEDKKAKEAFAAAEEEKDKAHKAKLEEFLDFNAWANNSEITKDNIREAVIARAMEVDSFKKQVRLVGVKSEYRPSPYARPLDRQGAERAYDAAVKRATPGKTLNETAANILDKML